ncbi:hypothetical protein PV761_22655 [Arthrobacter sp. CC3]|uniref:hypothetical protein n=1 Tax=Arthrobacter sp. CC3 TaxID=3029185 RepID=UPI00326756EE
MDAAGIKIKDEEPLNIPWYRPLLEAVEVKRHLFWHSSKLNQTKNFLADLETSKIENHVINVIDCSRLQIQPSHDLDIDSIESLEADIFIVANFDTLLTINHGKTWMRQLRPAVMQHLGRGARLIVASNAPQNHFPAIDGSSLATDCVQYIGERWRYDQLLHYGTPENARRLVSLSAGMPGPAAELIDRFPDLSRATGKDAVACLKNHITATMIQCGSDSISWLESAVLLRGDRQTPYDEIPANVATTLHASGLGSLDFHTDCLEILPGVSDATTKACVELAERSFLDAPPQWTKIAAALFTFERTARALLADSAATQEALVDLLSGHTEKIRRNFTAENGIPAPDLSSLPNPARWIDLSDLLDLLINISENSRVGGLTSKQWSMAKSEVLPIRNKIQHMRLPSAGDKRAIERHIRSVTR